MSELASSRKQPMYESRVTGIIKEVGGVKALRNRKDEFHQVVVRVDRERANLVEKYPDK